MRKGTKAVAHGREGAARVRRPAVNAPDVTLRGARGRRWANADVSTLDGGRKVLMKGAKRKRVEAAALPRRTSLHHTPPRPSTFRPKPSRRAHPHYAHSLWSYPYIPSPSAVSAPPAAALDLSASGQQRRPAPVGRNASPSRSPPFSPPLLPALTDAPAHLPPFPPGADILPSSEARSHPRPSARARKTRTTPASHSRRCSLPERSTPSARPFRACQSPPSRVRS
jgi:hypothetical protein